MNLITLPRNQWQSVSFSEERPKWKWASDRIIQQASSTSKKFPTGFSVVTSAEEHFNQLRCVFSPGNVYHSGMIFNFKDNENFMLAVVNNLSTSYKGYQLMIGEVLKGDFSSVCVEKYQGRLEADCTLELKESDGKLLIALNENDVFEWENVGLDRQSRLGLYTQQNKDAQFFELDALEVAEAVSEVQEDSITDPGSHLTQDELTVLPEQEKDPILDYLKIKAPKANTQVEFDEVFTVPLDSFYSYLRDVIDGVAIEPVHTQISPKLETLDLRPKRWYRQLRSVDNLLETLEILRKTKVSKKSNSQKLLEDLLQSDDSSKEEIANAENNLVNFNDELQAILIQIEKAQDAKALLLREVRTNGYSVGEITDATISDSGFNFQITKPSLVDIVSKSVPISENLDLSDDKVWKDALHAIETELYGGTIRESAKAVFEKESHELESIDTNSRINEKILEIQKDISVLETDLGKLRPLVEEMSKVVKGYETTIAQARIEKAKYLDFNRSDYPLSGDTTSVNAVNESQKLHNWIAKLPTVSPYSTESKSNGVYQAYNNARTTMSSMKFSPLVYQLGELRIIALREVVPKMKASNGTFTVIFNYLHVVPEPGSGQAGFRCYNSIKYPISGPTRYSFMHMAGTYDVKAFFESIIQLLQEYSSLDQSENAERINRLHKMEAELNLQKMVLADYKTSALAEERRRFILFWNDPHNSQVRNLHYTIIYPDLDPLAEFLVKLEGEEGTSMKTYYFSPTENGYVNQYGQNLVDFIESNYLSLDSTVSLFPVLEENGNFSKELIKIVKNPSKSSAPPNLPIIKFIETYKISIGWRGFGLGELSRSINLFPGESKELIIEKKTKLTSKIEQTTTSASDTAEKSSSSFEDNLQNTFSQEDKQDNEEEDKIQIDNVNTGSTDSTKTSESSSSFNWKIEAKASWGWGSASAQAGGSKSSKRTNSTNNKKAFSLAQNNTGTKASKQSKEILNKNINNTIKKVANETSINNKVEFSSLSSDQYEEETTNKEIIKLENPNEGKTANYNFFQLQNLFGVSVSLSDVKVVINTGNEVVGGTGINDLRVYELEDFGKVYANSSKSNHDLLIASIVTRQVLKQYTDFENDKTLRVGALRLDPKDEAKKNSLDILSYTSEEFTNQFTNEELVSKLKRAMADLKSMSFSFHETEIDSDSLVAVNSGSYHLESQVGLAPATEEYLEKRRDIETEKQKALVEEIKKRTEKEVFFQELPEGLTHLNSTDSTENES